MVPRKLVSFFFSLDSWENKTKCFLRDHTLSVYLYCKEKLQVHHFWDDLNKEDPVCYLMNLMGNLGNNLSSIFGFFFLFFLFWWRLLTNCASKTFAFTFVCLGKSHFIFLFLFSLVTLSGTNIKGMFCFKRWAVRFL